MGIGDSVPLVVGSFVMLALVKHPRVISGPLI